MEQTSESHAHLPPTVPPSHHNLPPAHRVDPSLNCIKGGGACQLREKVLAEAAKTFIVVADYRKESNLLGEKWTQGVPIEVAQFAYASVMRKLEALGGKPVLRMGGGAKAGPCVTDNRWVARTLGREVSWWKVS